MDSDPDFGSDYDKNFSETGSTSSLELEAAAAASGLKSSDLKTSEKCEKLEQFINNMMRKAELLNTTREEQIQKKQQILEELQKVQ